MIHMACVTVGGVVVYCVRNAGCPRNTDSNARYNLQHHLPLSNFFPSGSISFTSNMSSNKTPAIFKRFCYHKEQIQQLQTVASVPTKAEITNC